MEEEAQNNRCTILSSDKSEALRFTTQLVGDENVLTLKIMACTKWGIEWMQPFYLQCVYPYMTGPLRDEVPVPPRKEEYLFVLKCCKGESESIKYEDKISFAPEPEVVGLEKEFTCYMGKDNIKKVVKNSNIIRFTVIGEDVVDKIKAFPVKHIQITHYFDKTCDVYFESE